jgi:hypothetical protein
VRLSFDDANRLTIRERLRPVRVLEGTVAVDARNRLVYRVAEASRFGSPDLPPDITLDGDWSLTADHALALALRQGGRRQRLTLRGAVVEATGSTLVFAVERRGATPDAAGERVTLAGRWQADARNRLVFLARKADGSEDRLTLQGGWEVDERHALVYRYTRRPARGGAAERHTVVFEGAWDVPGADRLAYRLAGSPDATFEFRAGLQSRSLAAAAGRLVYDVGIGLERGIRRRRVSLFGTWKLNRDLSVTFEVPYAGGRVQGIRFEGSLALGRRDSAFGGVRQRRDRLAVELSAGRGEGLGLTVTFTRRLVPDASLFLRLKRDAEERSAIGGVQVRF